MLNVVDYINLILKKKNMSRADLVRQLNIVEARIGEARTTAQNVTNYLNGYHALRPKWLAKVEAALDLPVGTLIDMVEPVEKDSKKELAEIIKKVREK